MTTRRDGGEGGLAEVRRLLADAERGEVQVHGKTVRVAAPPATEIRSVRTLRTVETQIALSWPEPARPETAREVPPLVGVLGGSRSDFPILQKAVELLGQLGIPAELRVVSAHRTPDRLFRYAEEASDRGIEVIVAGAGGAAHLPGMLAAKTHLPVIGVPIPTEQLRGLDSLLSIVQMPRGVPVATVAIGGAENAALLAAQILAGRYPAVRERLKAFRDEQTRSALHSSPEMAGPAAPAGPEGAARGR